MIKKLFKRLFLLLLLTGFIFDNIKSHSVYYAQRMPHGEGQMPEVIMLIDNLFWVENPEIEGIRYRIDGTRTILNGKNDRPRFGNIYADETIYIYKTSEEMTYMFNYRLELLYVSEGRNYEEIDINTVDQEKIKTEIKAFVQPVIDTQPTPTINLQWLFNLIYQNKFK